MPLQCKLRIEVVDEHRDSQGEYQWTDTIIGVEVELAAGMEIPGERLIQAAKLAYAHMIGSDFQQLIAGEARGG